MGFARVKGCEAIGLLKEKSLLEGLVSVVQTQQQQQQQQLLLLLQQHLLLLLV